MTSQNSNLTDNLEVAIKELAIALGELQVKDATHIRDSKSYVILRKHGTDCNIEARYDPKPGTEVLDEYGNEFVQMELTVMATYPSHGGADVDVAFDRAHFIMEVCLVAMKLKNAFMNKKVYWLHTTADSRKKKQQDLNTAVVRQAILANCKGMKIGQSQKFRDGMFSDQLVPGVYQIEIVKTRNNVDYTIMAFYTAEVSESKVVTVTRNAAPPPTEAEVVDAMLMVGQVFQGAGIPK